MRAPLANRTSGSVQSSNEYPLHSVQGQPSNENASGIVTDGTNLWVVDDGSTDSRVFVYNMGGLHLGNWAIDLASDSPTGITLDPNQTAGDLWIVDKVDAKVYRYKDVAGADER